jgi:TolA-binding protein
VNSARHLSFIAVILIINIAYAPLEGAEQHDLKKQFDFAESLFTEADYFRAITEYKRFIFYYPQDNILTEKAAFRIGESYFKAARWQEALLEFSRFLEKYPQSPMRYDAEFHKGLSERYLKQYDTALSTFEELTKENKASTYHDAAIYQIALIRLDKREWQLAKNTFSRIQKDSNLFPSANVMSSGLSRINELPQKSPGIAGTLAAILPGAGHLYTERPKDAIVSFILNGSFIWAAAELMSNDNYAAGTVVALIELAWYSGNIYSAYNSAHKYNKSAQDKFIENLKEKSGFSFYFNPNTHTNYVMYCFKF